MWNYKIAMATFRTSQCQDGDEVLKCLEWRCQGLKRPLENLDTWKSTSRRILTGILTKNSELKPNLSPKRSREWSSRSIRSRINLSKIQNWKGSGNYEDLGKTRVKLFPYFTRHTHTYFLKLPKQNSENHLISISNLNFRFSHVHGKYTMTPGPTTSLLSSRTM